MLVSVIAYHAVHLLRTRLKGHGISLSWESIRNRMDDWRRVTTNLKEVGGEQVSIRQDVRPGAEAQQIARAAGVTPRLDRRQVRAPK